LYQTDLELEESLKPTFLTTNPQLNDPAFYYDDPAEEVDVAGNSDEVINAHELQIFKTN